MTIVVQPLTLQITGRQPRLRAQLQAAWPRTVYTARRTRAIHSITKHIKDTLPADYKGDVSVFVSNEVEEAHIPSQGFIYHLNLQNIQTRRTIHEADNAALLYIHYETAQALDELDDDAEEEVPQSRIEQIKQWQKETMKAVLQCMADTALSMAAQTALLGTMAGLNKLGALLAKASGAATKSVNPAAKQAAQKAVTRDIASTLSDLRSNLNIASTNGVKPPTKAQLAIRQQLNKLNKITTPKQQAVPVQKTQIKAVTMPIKAALLNVLAKAEAKPNRDIKTTPRVSVMPPRVMARIAERVMATKVSVQPTRFAARITKFIVQKLAKQPQRVVVPTRLTAQHTRLAARFQINRAVIPTLRITPAVIAKYIAANPVTITAPATQKAAVTNTIAAKTITSNITAVTEIGQKANVPRTITPLRVRPQAQLQRIARQPAQYSAIAKAIPSYRNPPRSFSHIGLVPTTINRVAIQPHFDNSVVAAPVSAAQQSYTAAPITPAAPPPYITPPYISAVIEAPRSEAISIPAPPPAPPPVQAPTQPTEPKPSEALVQPSAQPPTTPPEKRDDLTAQEAKAKPKTPDTNGMAPESAKRIDTKLPAPEKLDAEPKAPPTVPTHKPIDPVESVSRQETQKQPVTAPTSDGKPLIVNPENGKAVPVQDNNQPVAPPAPSEATTPSPTQPPKQVDALPEPREPSNVVPFQQVNPRKGNGPESETAKEKPTADVVNLEEKRLEKSKGLPKPRVATHVEDPQGLIVKVSGGTGTYREFVRVVEHDHNPIITQVEAKPPSSLPERPEAQEAYKSKLGRVLDMGCG